MRMTIRISSKHPRSTLRSVGEPGALLGRGRSAEIYAHGDDVVKLFHADFPRDMAQREAVAAEIVSASDASAPRFRGTVEADGRYGFVMERLDGPTMMHALMAKPWFMPRAAWLLADLHLGMHERVITCLPSQREQVAGMIALASDLTVRSRQLALDRLAQLPDGDRLCHGDFHPDNVILTAGAPVVIDWAWAGCGCPAGDVALTSLLLTLGVPLPGIGVLHRAMIRVGRHAFHALYLRRYLHRARLSRADIVAWRLPLATARLAAGIEGERGPLLAVIRDG
jgi:aminoglycoside phosphotransferase (APT) family kinase protein